MSWQAILMFAVVAGVGIPAAFRNVTALAMVIAWLSVELVYQVTGDSLPLQYSFMADIAVVAVIYAKANNEIAGRNQLRRLITDLTVWDRWIVGVYLFLTWPAYVFEINAWLKWHLLWACMIAQFLAAAFEAFLGSRNSVSRGKTKSGVSRSSGGDRFLDSGKAAQMHIMAFAYNLGAPAFARPSYTSHAGRIRSLHALVFGVPRLAALAQVGNSVVRRIAVKVVDVLRWPLPVINRPSDTVDINLTPTDPDLAVAFMAPTGRLLASVVAVPNPPKPFAVAVEHFSRSRKPKQFPRLRIIAEQLTKRFRGRYFQFSHGEESFRGGQGRAVLDAPPRPAFSSISEENLQRRGADAAFEPPVNSDSPSDLLVAYEGKGYG